MALFVLICFLAPRANSSLFRVSDFINCIIYSTIYSRGLLMMLQFLGAGLSLTNYAYITILQEQTC